MDKEQLINLINSLEITEISSIDIGYFTEKNYNNYDNRELKVISYGHGINEKINSIRQDMERMSEYLRRDFINTTEEIINSKLNK